MATTSDGQSPKAPVIETAAGTTSSDNKRSGNLAYVIAAVTIVVLGLIGAGMGGCIRLASDIAEHNYDSDSLNYNESFPFEDDFFDEFNDMDNGQDTNPFGQDDQGNGYDKGTNQVKDVLGDNLNLYSLTIDSRLPAMDYANSQQPVREFVRDIVVIDRNATSDIATTLRNASWNDGDIKAALAEARTKADEAVELIRNEQMPTASGDKASSISHSLEVGKSNALKRWEAIIAQLDLFAANDTVTSSELRSLDNDLQEATYDAAESFSAALTDSAAR